MQMQKFSELVYERPQKSEIFHGAKAALRSMNGAKSYADFRAGVLEAQRVLGHFHTEASLAGIRHTIDTSDKFYEAEQKYFDDTTPQLMPLMMKYAKYIVNSPFREEFAREFGSHYITMQESNLKKMSIKLIAPMQRENALTREYEKLLASCKVEFNGETCNLSGLRKYLQDPDRETRKAASHAIGGFLKANSDKLDEIYDKLVKLRTSMGKKMGYKNFTPLGYLNMDRYSYTAEDVKKFRDQVAEELVPVCTELRKRQAERIGVDRIYDYDESFIFTNGNAAPHGEVDELVAAAKKMYNELSKETGEFFDYMVQYELMDLINRPNKRVGGYCTDLFEYRAPFIFANFNGTSADVDVLTHEAGHAFAGTCAGKNMTLIETMFPTMETCEIHSMSMEFFTHPWMELFFGDEADKYRYAHLLEALLFIPYGVCVDEFQHVVYDNPDMTPAQRKTAWRELEKKYLPHRNYDDDYYELGGFWQKQHHIYSLPFYYIDYCLASMGAFEFFGKIRADKASAWADYYRLCCAGGAKPYRQLLKESNLSDPFEPGSVKRAIAEGVKVLFDTDDMALQK